ncbi:precorrin-6y C5,15-methyltransferase (decarboxylating) subunit CbiE [Candidatus Bathycorpusculum sp.]|uniref:precorrin-6y C5,15-methyltransferase (decarboxylating) subunit CbiE n=1 Tax=Candidatus Bathycorpusculum sp. TaxID=2994959 RepID=UPI0028323CED|nr:precorrin-6y C5,15-methyltransferase (decarboxylating) subunit CbiE [Candidatus Termitimicrobium sp.]MCL2431570.1 precorrin-6y C5,15-methyltransferase (decarboxylating) subunit CbiE [Candidatus Termitimicrobium sp.]
MAKLDIVGVGPGLADYVTPAARKTVQQADLVIGAQRSLALFLGEFRGEQIVLTAKNLQELLKKAAQAVKADKRVVLLSTGDPGFSGLLHTVLESGLFSVDSIQVVPGISSIQACAARLNISWDTARLFTFHEGKVSDDQKSKLSSAVQCNHTILLLPNQRNFTPKDIAIFLLKTGADPKTPVYVCENITLENEKITKTTIEGTVDLSFGSLCVMIIKQTDN